MKKLLILLIFFQFFQVSAQSIISKSNLTDQEKIYGLSKFWSEVAYNFAYFDKTKINWDSTYNAFIPRVLATKNTWDYYQELEQFCALLKDGHTGIFSPPDLIIGGSRYREIEYGNFNKRIFVTNVREGLKDKIPLGSEVLSIDGKTVEAYFKEKAFPYISASTEHQLWNDATRQMFYGTDTTQIWKVELKTPKGKLINHDARFFIQRLKFVTEKPAWKRSDFKIMDDIAYFQINTFDNNAVIDDFKAILPEIYKVKGVVIDLRKNGGGSSGNAAEILKYFTEQKVLIGSKWKTRNHLASHKAWGASMGNVVLDSLPKSAQKNYKIFKGDYWYEGDYMIFQNDLKDKKITLPLVVLTSNNTASAAEDFLIILEGLKNRAITIGQKTYGSTGQPLHFSLPGGGGARVCTKKDTYPDGREFVGYGIKPTIEVERNINDVLTGQDTELSLAIKELKKLIK